MAKVEIEAKKREGAGKSLSKKIRRDGWIPAILYGAKKTPVMLSVSEKEFRSFLKLHESEHIIADLKIDDVTKRVIKVLVRDIQHHPITQSILHIDFQHISMTKEIVVTVPVVTVGTPVGVKDYGGILELLLHELEIKCLPKYIPEHFEVDVSGLNIGDSIHVADLRKDNIEILTDSMYTVATIVPPAVYAPPPTAEEKEVPEEPALIEKHKVKVEEKETGKTAD